MKKVLFIWEKLSLGGAEVALLNLAEKLSVDNRVDCDLFLVYDINDFHRYPFKTVFTAKTKTHLSKFSRAVDLLYVLFRLLKLLKRYHVIVINDVTALSIVALFIRPFFSGKIIFWSHLGKSHMTSVASKLAIFVNYFVLKYIAHHIVCVSQYAKKQMDNYLNSAQDVHSSYIYNVVVIDKSYHSEILFNRKVFNLLSVTRFCPEKGVDILITAFSILINKGYDLRLTICGDGADRDKLFALVNQYGIQDKICFVGNTTDSMKFIASCDILISSSYTETFSLVVAEALMYNKPVVATNTGAAEILENGKYGLLSQIGNSDDLAAKIELLINNDMLRERLIKHSKQAVEKLDVEIITKKWLKLLDIKGCES